MKRYAVLQSVLFILYFLFFAYGDVHSQNVGIGIAVPLAKFHVNTGTIRFEGYPTPGNTALSIGGYGAIEIDAPNVPGGRFIVNDEGNVGIATTSPAQRLHVNGNAAFAGKIGINNTAPAFQLSFSNIEGDKISLSGNNANHTGFGMGINTLLIHTANSSEDILFGFGNSTAFTERVRFKGNGNVGIGMAPLEKLDVNGSIRASGYKLSADKTYYLSIPACAFKSGLSTEPVLASYNTVYMLSSSTSDLNAPVELPHNATISSITAYFTDNSAGQNIEIRMHSSNGTEMALVASSGIPGSSNGTDNTIGASLVNNTTRSYSLSAYCTGGPWNGTSIQLHSVLITYTLSEL